jgi:hypothetical protein
VPDPASLKAAKPASSDLAAWSTRREARSPGLRAQCVRRSVGADSKRLPSSTSSPARRRRNRRHAARDTHKSIYRAGRCDLWSSLQIGSSKGLRRKSASLSPTVEVGRVVANSCSISIESKPLTDAGSVRCPPRIATTAAEMGSAEGSRRSLPRGACGCGVFRSLIVLLHYYNFHELLATVWIC